MFYSQLSEKERDAIHRIDVARGMIAMQWEDKLHAEMGRLNMELEQIALDDKKEALEKLRRETDEELQALTSTFTAKQEELEQEVTNLKELLGSRHDDYEKLVTNFDAQKLESRKFLERAEREHQTLLDKEILKKETMIGKFDYFFVDCLIYLFKK